MDKCKKVFYNLTNILGIFLQGKNRGAVMKANMVIIHGGGPTAVINSSLYGVIEQAKNDNRIDRIYGAIGGTGGMLNEMLLDLKGIPEDRLKLLLSSPASAIGTSRDHLEDSDYDEMMEAFKRNNIKYVLLNGGNGTMDTCGKIFNKCRENGICVVGIPKTMDNDIMITDHSPGYASAARYMAASVAEVCADVRSLPIHVVIIEASGRNAGWVTAASALAKQSGVDGPDLIYLPERPFNEDEFLEDVSDLIKKKRGAVVVASEGLKNAQGMPIVEPLMTIGRVTYFGDVSAHLKELIIKKLDYKARSEKPGILARASTAWQSSVDRDEAVLAGELAAKAVLSGETGKMVGFERISSSPYEIKPIFIDIDKVMMHERKMPEEFINAKGNYVTDEFVKWCTPLIGESLPEFVSFRDMQS